MIGMPVRVEIIFRKRTNSKLAVSEYILLGHRDKRGRPIITSAVIKADPLLTESRNLKFKIAILKHELREIKYRVKGLTVGQAHKKAKSEDPVWLNKYKTHRQLYQVLKEVR